jgi:hypothetical protein
MSRNRNTSSPDEPLLTKAEASHFAQLALKCVTKEYPNKPDHTINDDKDVKSPRTLHPAFYGCFDWHSSVHGHWMLVRLLRSFPELPEATKIRAALNANLAAETLRSKWRISVNRTGSRLSVLMVGPGC